MGLQHVLRHALIAAAAGACALACSALEPTARVTVATTFSNPVLAGRAREVSTTVLALGADDASPCPRLVDASTTPATSGLSVDDEATRALDADGGRPVQVGFIYELPLGTKALYGEARDETGAVIARGCVTSAVSDEATIDLPLSGQ